MRHTIFIIFTQSTKKGSDEYNAIAQMAVTERDPDQDAQEQEPAGPEGPTPESPYGH